MLLASQADAVLVVQEQPVQPFPVLRAGIQGTIAKVSQLGLQAWLLNAPTAKVTQLGLQGWFVNTPDAKVTLLGVQLWFSGTQNTQAAVTQLGLQVWTVGVAGGGITPFIWVNT